MAVFVIASTGRAMEPVEYVNPLRDIEGGGNPTIFRGASLPFGMIMAELWEGRFALTSLSGCYYGMFKHSKHIEFVPAPYDTSTQPRFVPIDTVASPGYVKYTDTSGISIEIAARCRSAIIRVHFPDGMVPMIYFKDGVHTHAAETVTGPEKDRKPYFHAVFDRSPDGIVNNDYLILNNEASGGEYVFKVGLSFVDRDNAELNLVTEHPNWDFEETKTAAENEWNDALSRVIVEGGTAKEKEFFYTCLYRCLFHMNVYSDVNGEYLGFDNQIHTAEDFTYYVNVSGWDVYRTWIQLVAWLFPQEVGDMMRSYVLAGKHGGGIPRWTAYNKETGVMNGDPALPIIANAVAFGARAFDLTEAYNQMSANAFDEGRKCGKKVVRPGLQGFLDLGYVPDKGSVTLEYCIGNFALSRTAEDLNLPIADTLLRTAQNWQHLYNPETGFLEARDNSGEFLGKDGFTEGTREIYTWMVPFNIAGLTESFGGRDAAIQMLEERFPEDKPIDLKGRTAYNTENGYIALNNQPGYGLPWVYNWLGRPWRTQWITRRALIEGHFVYLRGEDDLGSHSSWCLWNMLGLYPAIPGVGGFTVNAPLFPRVTITLPNEKELVIEAQNADAQSPYIQSLSLNGSPTENTWIDLADLKRNTNTISFVTSNEPNSAWGTAEENAPPSFDATPMYGNELRDCLPRLLAPTALGSDRIRSPFHTTPTQLGRRAPEVTTWDFRGRRLDASQPPNRVTRNAGGVHLIRDQNGRVRRVLPTLRR